MPDDPQRASSGLVWPVGLLVLVVAYFASTGPLAGILRLTDIGPSDPIGKVVIVVYWPVYWLVEVFPQFERTLRWYCDLFVP